MGAPGAISFRFPYQNKGKSTGNRLGSHMESIEGEVFKCVAGCGGSICSDLSSSMSKQLKKVPSNDWQLLGETFGDMLLISYRFSLFFVSFDKEI